MASCTMKSSGDSRAKGNDDARTDQSGTACRATTVPRRTRRQPVTDGTTPPGTGLNDPRALQILSTEHWSLLAGRSLAYNEAFTRAGMFLTALSASMVAIAFVAQADRAGSAFPTFTLILLGFDLFVGLTTYLRLVETTREDLPLGAGHEPDPSRLPRDGARARAVLRVERSRRPCRHPDDLRGTVPRGHDGRTAGCPGMLHGFSTNTGMIAVVVSLVGASFAGVAVAQVGDSMAPVVGIGAIVFFVLLAGLMRIAVASMFTYSSQTVSLFPSDVPQPSVPGAERAER